MKKPNIVLGFGVLLALVISVIPFGNVVYADGAEIVIGNDDSDCSDGSCDSKTLQDALNAAVPGAKLIIKGTFNFGVDQFVSLKKDVTIKGARGPREKYQGIIKGGMNTFALGWDPAMGFTEFDEYCGLISNNNTERWPAKFTIKDLKFVDPTWSAIMGAATTGTTVENNQFIGGYQRDAGCNAYGFEPPDGSMTAVYFNTWPDARIPVMGSPSDITGQIILKNNYFDGDVRMDPNGFDPAHGGSSMVHGEPILMNGMMTPIEITGTDAQFTVKNNRFENIMWGIFFADNSGTQVVKNNKIRMSPEDEDGNPIGFVWAGISVQNYGDRVNKSPVTIKNNYIYSRVPDFVYGILSASQNATIINNHLVLEQPQESLWNLFSDSAGFFIPEESIDNLVKNNTIKGSGQVAILVLGYDEISTSENNLIKNNDVSDFTPFDAIDVWCRVFGGTDCPTVPGAHYHLTLFTSNNTIIDRKWRDGMLLLDDTSDFNPYDPATYNGDNNIQLGR